MQKQFDEQTRQLGERLGAVVIPVGDYWATAYAQRPDIRFYNGDGTHPGPGGAYLSALVFYRYFAGHNPAHVTFAPDGVTAEQAAFLRGIASW